MGVNGSRKTDLLSGGRYVLKEKIQSIWQTLMKEQKEKRKWLLIIALVGILFIVIGDFFQKKEDPNLSSNANVEEQLSQAELEEVVLVKNVAEMEALYETDLTKMLNKISGVSEVEVMVNIDSTNIQMYEKDTVQGTQSTVEVDQNGGERTIKDETKETKLVFVRQGDEEVPLLVKTQKPSVRGVFIIAKGVENAHVKQMVVESVSRVLDVPTYRISVVPR